MKDKLNKLMIAGTTAFMSAATFAAEGDGSTWSPITTITDIKDTLVDYVDQALPIVGTLIGVAAGVMVLFMAVKLIKRALSKA